jgi:hypothetical protein
MTKNAEKTPEPVATPSGVYEDGPFKGLRWEDFDIFGETYRVRQVLVSESDEAFDASMCEDGQVFNGRLNTRLLLSSAVESPAFTADDIAAWPAVRLTLVLRAYNKLNTLPPADEAGND